MAMAKNESNIRPDNSSKSGPLAGKVAIVTGATSGIGLAVTQQLLQQGATVYLAARSESKAKATISRLKQEVSNVGEVKALFLELKLDHPKDARASAEEFLKREKRLDILISNASLLLKKHELGPIGIQDSMTVNHISAFVFVNTLLPLLRETASIPGSDVRIITTASNAHTYIKRSDLPSGFSNLDILNGPDAVDDDSFKAQSRRYGLSKLANILYTRALGERLTTSQANNTENHILVMCVHPGAVATEGNFRTASSFPWPLSSLAHLLIRTFFRTPAQGARCIFDAATAVTFRKGIKVYQGKYLEPAKGVPSVKLGKLSDVAQDADLAQGLWELTESVLNDHGINSSI